MKQSVTIHNSYSGLGKAVEAHLVGGIEGVFAAWRDEHNTIHLAKGDDGYYVEIMSFNTHWADRIIEALKQAKG